MTPVYQKARQCRAFVDMYLKRKLYEEFDCTVNADEEAGILKGRFLNPRCSVFDHQKDLKKIH